MHFYSPSPLSLGYIPRVSYRPALVYTYLGDESSSALTSEGLGYPAFSHTHTSTPRLGAETRYRRAVHGLQAAEEELEAHLTLKRARQAAFLREQAARRERVLAIQAEVDRIERARALQAQLAEEYEWYQRAPQAQAALDQRPLLLHAFADTNPRDLFASGLPFARERPTDSGPSRHPVLHDSEVPTLEGLLKLFTGIRPQPHGPLQQSSSPAPSQHHPAEPQPSEKQDAATDAFNAVLEFIHGLAAHAANGSETIPEAAPVDEKGKAKAEPAAGHAAGPTLLQTLLGAYTQGPSDQESKDIELAIKLSLEDRDAADAKKASAAKTSQSSLGASSSSVKLDGAVPSSQTPSSASDTTSATSQPIPGPVPQPVSPLTAIRAVRNQLSTLESTFKFPVDLDFDQSVLAISLNNAPLRAHENTLNGLLEHLDAFESDGDEEVRNTRREVVREVEKALEDLERRVSEKVFELQVIKDAEAKVYDGEALAVQDTVPADAASVAKDAKPTGPEPSATVFPSDGDADVDLAISEEYFPSPTAVESSKPAVAQTADKDVSSLDAAPVLEDSSDSAATIAAIPVSASLASP